MYKGRGHGPQNSFDKAGWQPANLGLTRIGKSNKSKSMTLKAKSSDIDESFDDEDFKMKSYITRQFKKFMKNANTNGFDKDRK